MVTLRASSSSWPPARIRHMRTCVVRRPSPASKACINFSGGCRRRGRPICYCRSAGYILDGGEVDKRCLLHGIGPVSIGCGQLGPPDMKLAVDTDSSRQKAAILLPLCACRSKRLRQAASFKLCDSRLSMSDSVLLNLDRIVPACETERYNTAQEPVTGYQTRGDSPTSRCDSSGC